MKRISDKNFCKNFEITKKPNGIMGYYSRLYLRDLHSLKYLEGPPSNFKPDLCEYERLIEYGKFLLRKRKNK